MENTTNQKPIIEVETVTKEHEIIFVKIRTCKEHLETTKMYAEMVKVEHNELLEELLATGIKTIRGQLNNMPYVSTKKLLKQYQTTPQTH